MEQSVKECFFMAYLKKAGRLTAGILGITIALGTAGSFPAAHSATRYSIAETPYQGLYSYVFEDVNIQSIDTASDYCTVIFSKDIAPIEWGGFNVAYTTIEFAPKPEIVETEDGSTDRLDGLRKRNRSLISQLREGTKATITVATDTEFPELESASGILSSMYCFEEVRSVSASYIHYYGDINDDGVVDSYDAIDYGKQLAGTADTELTSVQLLNGDINFNNEIDEDDFQQVRKFLLGIKTQFNEASPIGSLRLDNTVDVLSSEGKVTDEEFASSEMKFGVELLKRCFDPTKQGGENFLISPVSISTALAMTANGADGKTREEMEKVLGNGLTIDQINEYMAYYVQNLPDNTDEKVYLANSVWIKDKPSFKVKDEFLETNKKFYNSEIYQAAFDNSTVKDVNSWVNTNTKRMIPTLLNNGDLDPQGDFEKLMLLINTLYFEADWFNKYTSAYSGIFTDLNGVEHNVQKMSNKEYEYFDLGDADAFKKPYANNNYSFVGILPREKNIIDYVSELDAEKLFDELRECEDPEEYDLTVKMPKFQYSYDTSLADVLEQMGMTTAFSHTTADFTKLYDNSVANAPEVYIDDILHKTRIEVTENGTKAAAVTAAMMGGFGGMWEKTKKEIIIDLDRPFVYMIVDKNNIPVFIGAATQIEE